MAVQWIEYRVAPIAGCSCYPTPPTCLSSTQTFSTVRLRHRSPLFLWLEIIRVAAVACNVIAIYAARTCAECEDRFMGVDGSCHILHVFQIRSIWCSDVGGLTSLPQTQKGPEQRGLLEQPTHLAQRSRE